MSTRSSTPFGLFKITEAGLYLRDNTISNATSSRHGLLPKLDGNSAHFLDGTGAWSTPAGGGGGGAMVFLERHAASSSAQLDFTTFISATYDKYVIVGESIIPATNGADFLLRVGTGGGPTYDTGANYDYTNWRYASNGASGNSANGSQTAIKIFSTMRNSVASDAGNFSITATALQSTALRKFFFGTGFYIDDTGPLAVGLNPTGTWNTGGTAATALRFLMSSGNITSGSITIYGYTNS